MKFTNRNVYIHPSVKLGANVKIGDNVTIYENVEIGDGTIICNDCVIGEPTASYYKEEVYENKKTLIGRGSLVRSHNVIYCGSILGDFFQTGHYVTIRENTVIGSDCSVGTKSDIQGDCIIGDYTRMHSYVNIGQKSKIGSYVMIFPFAVLTNDPLPPSNELVGVTIKDYSIISSHSVLIGGVTVGEHCLIGANCTVNKDIPDDTLVAPNSGIKLLAKLSRLPFFTERQKRKYPWPFNFSRGMPWDGTEYESWLKQNQNLKNTR